MAISEVKNLDFFDNKIQKKSNINEATANISDVNLLPKDNISTKLIALTNDVYFFFEQADNNLLRNEVQKILSSLNQSKFKVSVVGEFSRGKSSFINRFFEREILPVGDLPTTALLTKITYNDKEMLVHLSSSGSKKPFRFLLIHGKG